MSRAPPAVSLVLTTLRLLDYDPQEHIPITPKVFSSLNNKQKAFEHIFYFLLSTYSPSEATERFAGVWPIFEPAQARDFRAKVYTWLTELKRDGFLHVSILRKSLLDECQGERYEELLVGLCGMVLRKEVESGRFKNVAGNAAVDIALGKKDDKEAKTVLEWGFKVSLREVLRERDEVKNRYEAVGKAIQDKEAELEDARAALPPPVDEAEQARRRELEEIWRRNWTGDERVLDAILLGEYSKKDTFLQAGFDRVLELEGNVPKGRGGFAEEIRIRVERQQARLERIRKLRGQVGALRSQSPGKTMSIAPTEPSRPARGLGIKFSAHEALRPDAVQPRPPPANENFTMLLDNLREDLTALHVPTAPASAALSQEPFPEAPTEAEEAALEFGLSPLKGAGRTVDVNMLGRGLDMGNVPGLSKSLLGGPVLRPGRSATPEPEDGEISFMSDVHDTPTPTPAARSISPPKRTFSPAYDAPTPVSRSISPPRHKISPARANTPPLPPTEHMDSSTPRANPTFSRRSPDPSFSDLEDFSDIETTPFSRPTATTSQTTSTAPTTNQTLKFKASVSDFGDALASLSPQKHHDADVDMMDTDGDVDMDRDMADVDPDPYDSSQEESFLAAALVKKLSTAPIDSPLNPRARPSTLQPQPPSSSSLSNAHLLSPSLSPKPFLGEEADEEADLLGGGAGLEPPRTPTPQRSRTPTEDIFASGDPSKIFKSRPKIKVEW